MLQVLVSLAPQTDFQFSALCDLLFWDIAESKTDAMVIFCTVVNLIVMERIFEDL